MVALLGYWLMSQYTAAMITGDGMVSIVWSDDYSVHINSIDNEHKLLIGLIQELDSALETQEMVRSQLVPAALERLKHCIDVHFESEERFMQLNNYPDFNSHHQEHQHLVQRLEQFVSYLNSNKLVFNDPMLLFLKDWLIRHILLDDSKFGKYFLARELARREVTPSP